jgi:hypothetical protein
MKKNILLIACLFSAFIHGMETKSWSITLGDTKINLNKGFMIDTYAEGERKIDIIVMGCYQQETLNHNSSCGYPVGECYVGSDTPRFKAREGSFDRGYKWSSRACNDHKLCTWMFPQRPDNPIFVTVREPVLYFEVDAEARDKANVGSDCDSEELEKYVTYPHYETLRLDSENKCADYFSYEGDQAIEEASKDLALCYANVLVDGLERLGEKKEKSIALPTLGTRCSNFAFPRKKAACVAVKSILTFIKDNLDAYDRVELFVEKQSEFKSYIQLLMEGCGLTKKICLLYLVYNARDDLSCLLHVPRDVINYIALFMFNNLIGRK